MAEKQLTFPSNTVPFEEKETIEYGMQVANAIENEWFKKEGGSIRYFAGKDRFNMLRLYARGEQSIAKYKKELAINGDLSYLNVDWKPVPIIPKFVDIVVNGILERPWEIKCYSQDPASIKKKTDYVMSLQKDMRNKDLYNNISDTLGINMFSNDPETLPYDEDELALHMQLDYKQSIEIAQEEAIANIFDLNKYPLTHRRNLYDLTEIGIAASRDNFNRTDGITLDYLDPAELVYSNSSCPYFSDMFYAGIVKKYSIPRLKKQFPGISDEDIKRIEKGLADGTAGFNSQETGVENEDGYVYILDFEYKTYRDVVNKVKVTPSGGLRAIRKKDTFNPPSPENGEEVYFERVVKTEEILFCGSKILGTDVLIDWKMAKNMTRPKSDATRVNMSFHIVAPKIYNGIPESLVSRIIGFADNIQKIDIKLQQVINRMVPDGVYLDADGLNQIDLGNGKSYHPQEALNMYFQTGSVIGRSMTVDGEYNHGKIPVQELTSSASQNKIQSLTASYHHYLGLIREVTGLNPARDAGTPDKDALVGVQKLAAANSNTATRHIVHASSYLTLTLAETATLRISDVLEFSDTRETFIRSLGVFNVATLDEISELHMHDFGLFLELAPDEEEKQMLENNIQISLAQKEITVDDAIDVRTVRNLKHANITLKKKRREREEKERIDRLENIQVQAQANQESAQSAAMAELQVEQGKSDIKMKEMKYQQMLDIESERESANIKLGLIREEAKIKFGLKEMDIRVIKGTEAEREDRKDERTRIQASQQSKLIEQRQYGTPTQDFESSGFDSLEITEPGDIATN